MSFFKVEIERDTQVFLKTAIERVCGSIDGLAGAVRDKKVEAKGSFEIKGG